MVFDKNYSKKTVVELTLKLRASKNLITYNSVKLTKKLGEIL